MEDGKELFSMAEAVQLAGVPRRIISKAIRDGLVEVCELPSRAGDGRMHQFLTSGDIYCIAFTKASRMRLSNEQKKQLWLLFRKTPCESLASANWQLDSGIEVRPGKLLEPVIERVIWYIDVRHSLRGESLDLQTRISPTR